MSIYVSLKENEVILKVRLGETFLGNIIYMQSGGRGGDGVTAPPLGICLFIYFVTYRMSYLFQIIIPEFHFTDITSYSCINVQ